jgi:hypothetical protein
MGGLDGGQWYGWAGQTYYIIGLSCREKGSSQDDVKSKKSKAHRIARCVSFIYFHSCQKSEGKFILHLYFLYM